MKVTESITHQYFHQLLLLLRTGMKYIVICVSICSSTLSYADESQYSSSEGWTIGAGLSLLKSEEVFYRYLHGEVSRIFESGILLAGEAAVSLDENREEDVDGSVFLSDYLGLSAGYQHRISESLSGTLKFFVGVGMTEEVSIDFDVHGTCECKAVIFKPTVALNAKLSENIWVSLDVSNFSAGKISSPWAGLSLKHKF